MNKIIAKAIPGIGHYRQQLTADEQALIRIYEKSRQQLTRLKNSITETDFARRRAKFLLEQVNKILSDLRAGQTAWANQSLSNSYKQGMVWAAKKTNKPIPQFALIHRQAVEAFSHSIASDMANVNHSIQGLYNNTIIQAQQSVVRWGTIADKLGIGTALGYTQAQYTQDIVKTLKDGAISRLSQTNLNQETKKALQQVATGNVVPILCKDGKTRHYDLKYYGELVAITATRQAASEGLINTCLEYGVDLVQVDWHDGACPICIPWQGMVFSLSGLNPDFPKYEDSEGQVPIHPHCYHVLMPAVEEDLRQSGTYDKLSEFSNDPDVVINNQTEYDAMIGD